MDGCLRVGLSGVVEGVAVAGGPRWRSGPEADELDPFEGGDELGDPGPAGGKAKPGASATAADLAGGVEQAVAEPFGFGPGEFTVEAAELGPHQQVLGDEGCGEPGSVDSEVS